MTKTRNNCVKILIVLSTTDIIIRKLTFSLVLVEITFSTTIITIISTHSSSVSIYIYKSIKLYIDRYTPLLFSLNFQRTKLCLLSLSLSLVFFSKTRARDEEKRRRVEQKRGEWRAVLKRTPTGLERQWNNVTGHVSETDRSQMGNKSHAMPRRSAPRGLSVWPRSCHSGNERGKRYLSYRMR